MPRAQEVTRFPPSLTAGNIVVSAPLLLQHHGDKRWRNAKHPQAINAEFWDSPGSSISYVKMAAAVTGTRPDLGESRKVRIVVPIEPQEGSADQAGAKPSEPPQESPPGSPRARGARRRMQRSRRTAAGPEELPGNTPRMNLPVRRDRMDRAGPLPATDNRQSPICRGSGTRSSIRAAPEMPQGDNCKNFDLK